MFVQSTGHPTKGTPIPDGSTGAPELEKGRKAESLWGELWGRQPDVPECAHTPRAVKSLACESSALRGGRVGWGGRRRNVGWAKSRITSAKEELEPHFK